MRAHQIIYTSCRKGIEGSSDGFQVFSYDRGLPNEEIAGGPGRPQLFPDPDPSEVGESAFGYHLVGGQCLFTFNTKLPHDYLGPQSRSGNVLRHTVFFPAADLPCAPIEFFGSSGFVSSVGSEVASPERPDYLPELEMGPSGLLSRERVVAWLREEDRSDVLLGLIRRFFEARRDGKQLVIVSEPEEAAFWIAALCLVLPLEQAQKMSFLIPCERPGRTGSDIVGLRREVLERGLGYPLATCVVFDPREDLPTTDAYAAQGRFLGFAGMSLELNPRRLFDFVAFLGSSCKVDLALDEYDAAYELWSILNGDLPGNESAFEAAISIAEQRAGAETVRSLCARLLDALSRHEVRGISAISAVTGFLLRASRRLPADEAGRVNDAVIAATETLLEDERVSPEEFSSYLDSLSDVCARAGIDLLALLVTGLREESSLEKASCSGKLAVVCCEVVSPSLGEGSSSAPVAPSPEVKELVRRLVRCAYGFGAGEGKRVALMATGPFASDAEVYLDMASSVLGGCEEALPRDSDAAGDLLNEIACHAVPEGPEQMRAVVGWLAAHGAREGAVGVFERFVRQAPNTRAVVRAYNACIADDDVRGCNPEASLCPSIALACVKELSSRADADAISSLRGLLSGVLKGCGAGQAYARRYASVVEAALRALDATVDLYELSSADRDLVSTVLEYEALVGQAVLPTRMAYAWGYGHLRSFARERKSDEAVMFSYELRPRIKAGRVGASERSEYLERIAPLVLALSSDLWHFAYLVTCYAVADGDERVLLDACSAEALKLLKKHERKGSTLGYALTYACAFCGRDLCRAMAESASKVRKDDVPLVEKKARQALDELPRLTAAGFSVDQDVEKRLEAVVARMQEGSGLRKLFRRR